MTHSRCSCCAAGLTCTGCMVCSTTAVTAASRCTVCGSFAEMATQPPRSVHRHVPHRL
jgi:hypothetical protein